jgi:hypothetical protein
MFKTKRRVSALLSQPYGCVLYAYIFEPVWTEYLAAETRKLGLVGTEQVRLTRRSLLTLSSFLPDIFSSGFPYKFGVQLRQVKGLKSDYEQKLDAKEIERGVTFGEYLAIHLAVQESWEMVLEGYLRNYG